ncbi:MAG: hypothetical protein AAGI17_08400 [Planctomycetota bacterium]
MIDTLQTVLAAAQEASGSADRAEALRRGVFLLMGLALMGVVVVTTLWLLATLRKPGRDKRVKVYREDAWTASAERVRPEDGDEHLGEHAPPDGSDDPDPNEETTGPFDEPWR